MSDPKLHHHLPQSYQLGFCGEDGRLFVFDRATGKFRKDTPKNVAAITNDYTLFRDGSRRDTSVEKFFAQIDGVGVSIAKKLRDGIRLTGDERESFSWYVAFFAVRVPAFRRWLSETETARRKLHDRTHLRSPEQIQALIDASDLTDLDRAEANAQAIFEMLKSEEYVVTVGHDYGVRLLVEAGCDLMPKIHNVFWIVAHAEDGAQFITSDNPLVQLGDGEALTFPVAVDTALLMMPAPSGKIHNYDKVMSADMVHATNVTTARACERLVLGRDLEYLRRVVDEAGIIGTHPTAFVEIESLY